MALVDAAKVADEAMVKFGGNVAAVMGDLSTRAAEFMSAIEQLKETLKTLRVIGSVDATPTSPGAEKSMTFGLLNQLLTQGYTTADEVKALRATFEGLVSGSASLFNPPFGGTTADMLNFMRMMGTVFNDLVNTRVGVGSKSATSATSIASLTSEIRSGQGGPLVEALRKALGL